MTIFDKAESKGFKLKLISKNTWSISKGIYQVMLKGSEEFVETKIEKFYEKEE
jgi:hypothetical protein